MYKIIVQFFQYLFLCILYDKLFFYKNVHILSVYLYIFKIGEMFTLKNIHNDMKMFEMKNYAEFVTGIPTDIQRIRYLDEGAVPLLK